MTTESRRPLRQVFNEGWNKFWTWDTWPWPHMWKLATQPSTWYVSLAVAVLTALTAMLWALTAYLHALTRYTDALITHLP